MIRGTVTQVCTTIEQSKRLISLGIDINTSDCHHWESEGKVYTYIGKCPEKDGQRLLEATPAWSLHRLYEMCPRCLFKLRPALHKTVTGDSIFYCTEINNNDEDYEVPFSQHCNLYDNIIDCIEWLIVNGYKL